MSIIRYATDTKQKIPITIDSMAIERILFSVLFFKDIPPVIKAMRANRITNTCLEISSRLVLSIDTNI